MSAPTPHIRVSAGHKGENVLELHNRQEELQIERQLLEQLQAAGVVRKKGEVYYLDFANGSWVYRAVGYADAISGGTVVILREVEEEKGAGDAS